MNKLIELIILQVGNCSVREGAYREEIKKTKENKNEHMANPRVAV